MHQVSIAQFTLTTCYTELQSNLRDASLLDQWPKHHLLFNPTLPSLSRMPFETTRLYFPSHLQSPRHCDQSLIMWIGVHPTTVVLHR